MGYSTVRVDNHLTLTSYYSRYILFEKNFKNKVFPIKLEWAFLIQVFFTILGRYNFLPYSGYVKILSRFFQLLYLGQNYAQLMAATIFSLSLTIAIVCLTRFGFILMLYYRGWLFVKVGKKVSWQTKIFIGILQFVNKYATTFSFAELMPWLPIPFLKSTIKKLLRTIRPIVDDQKYNKLVQLSEEFLKTAGPTLQRKLWLKWMFSTNYVSDWWKEVVYMRYRCSLIRTNVCGPDVIYQKTTNIQAARAANQILLRLNFLREVIEEQKFKPITMGGIPLCPSQYPDFYYTVRIPGETCDTTIRVPKSRHIVVHCKGCWYKVEVFHAKRLLRPAELERVLQKIIDRKPDPGDHEPILAAITMGPRELWARIRREKFSKGLNKESLDGIEHALDVVWLDEDERFFDETDPSKYEYEYARTLHGDGYRLWCDKPSNHTFSKNGRVCGNAEHSSCDAMIFSHIREYIKYHEEFTSTYTFDSHCRGEVEVEPLGMRLKWDFDQETKDAIDEAYKFAKEVADDFENASLTFKDFGKDYIKKLKMSPDAFIQMAIQYAYFKDQGKFELTYEPAVMRLFKDGRTDTVRSCSIESCDFVRSMIDPKIDDKTRFELLKKACDQHQDYCRNAMAGKGIDRHLFALYVVSKHLHISSKFLDEIFAIPYALSTSQTPQHQMVEYMDVLNKDKDLFWPAGGFCCPDGSNYGICYTIAATGDLLSFHISSWKSIKNTNAYRFRETLTDSLLDMKEMCDRAMK